MSEPKVQYDGEVYRMRKRPEQGEQTIEVQTHTYASGDQAIEALREAGVSDELLPLTEDDLKALKDRHARHSTHGVIEGHGIDAHEDRACLLAEVERLRKALSAAWCCLEYVGPTNEYSGYARDLIVQALGEDTIPDIRKQWGNASPLDAARSIIGPDYPRDGWEDGVKPRTDAPGARNE
jgi:hypothetical protein